MHCILSAPSIGLGILKSVSRNTKTPKRLGDAALDADDVDERADFVLGHSVADRTTAMDSLLVHFAQRPDHRQVHHRTGLRVDHVIAPSEPPTH